MYTIFFSNIDVRIQQAELEYRLGREELELLTLHEESRALQTALELAETQEKQKNDTIFRYIFSIFLLLINIFLMLQFFNVQFSYGVN